MENIPAKPQIHEHSLIAGAAALLLSLFISAGTVCGQDQDIPKKAFKHFEKALEYYRLQEPVRCEQELNKALNADSTFSDAWILAGDLYYESGRLDEAIHAYRKSLDYGPERPMVVRELLAQTLFRAERYGEAVKEYDILLAGEEVRHELKRKLEENREIARFRQSLMDNPVSYSPVNMGPAVNTGNEEYVNTLGAESDQLIFTRKFPASENPMQREFEEDFYRTFLTDTGWTKAERFAFIPSAFGDAGGLSMSADGTMLFFTACFRPDSHGSCDIYYSVRQDKGWSTPKNMGEEVNSDNWDAQPSISPDGSVLYFASNREGSLGSSDIWMTERLAEGAWSKPVNLGAPVNTREAEMAPYIHFDNETLYFSSEGHPGMGGHDLFISRRDEMGWGEPSNLGYPVNTLSDELVIVVSPDAEEAFISASLPGGEGGYDIYSFPLTDELRPVPVTYVKGRVYDRDTGKPLEARFGLYDLATDSLVMRSSSSPLDGTFLVCLPLGRSYALHVSRPGYLFYSDHFELQKIYDSNEPFIMDIPLDPLAEGRSIVLKNIFYDTDKFDLKKESETELNRLVEFLMVNPGVHIEISGHTDNVGSEEYNLELSRKRAGSVYDYLISQGIPEERLTYAGYGFNRPVASNDTEAGRAANRRTELEVVRLEQINR